MNNIVCRLSLALMATSVCSTYIIPKVYEERGYWAIGGEWILLGIIFWLAYKVSKNKY